MDETTLELARPSAPAWLLGTAGAGVAWNLYGVYQFIGSLTPAGQAAMTAGMTSAQAEVYLALPAWISVVFAVGVFGGLIGSTLLLARRNAARGVLLASLLGYALLFGGDAAYGVFAAVPSQLAILAVVVAIAAVLSWVARRAARHGLLH